MQRFLYGLLIGLVVWAGCSSHPAQQEFDRVSRQYRPKDNKPELPLLTEESALSDFATYALYNNPRVEAAFYDWKASIENITVAHALPAPKLTLGAELQNGVKAFLPGISAEIPWPKKTALQAEQVSAEAQTKRYLFEEEILKTVFTVSQIYYEGYLLKEQLRLARVNLDLWDKQITWTQLNLGTGSLNAEELTLTQNEQARMRNELTSLEDSCRLWLARWQAALGIKPTESAPPVPVWQMPATIAIKDTDLLETALTNNVRLKALSAELKQAETALNLAKQENFPDMMVSAKTDTKKDPFWWMPELTLTLPIWRQKINAQIAAAQAQTKQNQAMLSAEQIDLAVVVAEKTFMWREINREINVLSNILMPNMEFRIRRLETGYTNGTINFMDWVNAQHERMDLQNQYLKAVAQRAILFTEISTVVLSHWPEDVINLFKKP
jgi:outer membrane protein, heavy metal efflux system